MATFDLRLKLYIAGAAMGVVLVIVAVVGEILGWWNDLGVVLGFLGVVATVALGLLAASRFQVKELGGEIRSVARGVERVEHSTQRIEANTEAIPGIKADTAQTVALLRDIRDRLPGPGR